MNTVLDKTVSEIVGRATADLNQLAAATAGLNSPPSRPPVSDDQLHLFYEISGALQRHPQLLKPVFEYLNAAVTSMKARDHGVDGKANGEGAAVGSPPEGGSTGVVDGGSQPTTGG